MACSKEFCDDGGDAVEEVRADAVLQSRLGRAAEADGGGKARRVHLGDIGGENQVGAGRLEPGDIAFLVARIVRQVLVRCELARVDEDGDDHPFGVADGLIDQAQMAVVQRPHGGHDRRAQALRPPLADVLAQLLDGADGDEARWRHGDN